MRYSKKPTERAAEYAEPLYENPFEKWTKQELIDEVRALRNDKYEVKRQYLSILEEVKLEKKERRDVTSGILNLAATMAMKAKKRI